MRVLYAGDSTVGGPANYLLGILHFLKADFIHVPPSETLSPTVLKREFDAFILSDFSRAHTPQTSQKAVARQIENGAGLLMVGGWGSFSGPFGGWRGSLIEKLLPAKCLNRDDRVNFPGGALIVVASEAKQSHVPGLLQPRLGMPPRNDARRRLLAAIGNLKNFPVICGLNQIQPKKAAEVLLSAKKILAYPLSPEGKEGGGEGKQRFKLSLDSQEYPLLVIDRDPQKRIAALATDLAPHWCGGLVDWGKGRQRIRLKGETCIEVGDQYVRFVSSLIRWLSGGE